MKFFSSLKTRFTELRTRLTHIGTKEPLSKLSLVVIILLDIFVLTVIFNGLSDTSRQLSTPEDYIPYDCQNYAINTATKTDEMKLDLVSNSVRNIYNYNPYPSAQSFQDENENSKLHPICKELYARIEAAKKSADLQLFFTTRDEYITRQRNIQSELNDLKGNYDTAILEKIANMPSSANEMQNTRRDKASELLDIQRKIKDIDTQVLSNNEYKAIWNYILDNQWANQTTLEKDLSYARFWFPVKHLAMDFLFLLPLLIVLYFWSSHSVKKDNGVQMLISSHLLVVVSIPLLWKILDMLLQIIPQKFLQTVIEWLTLMNLLAVWYYVLVIIGILAALGIIYLIQKKFFNKSRLIEKRLVRGECIECGKFLRDKNVESCYFCGTKQYTECLQCHKKTLAGAEFCMVCGEKK